MTISEIKTQIMGEITPIFQKAVSEGGFCVADRQNTRAFFDILRDSMYVYEPDYILVERLFKKDKCIEEAKEIEVYTEQSLKDMEAFRQLLEEVNGWQGTDELEKNKDRIRIISERAQNIEMEKKEMRILTYVSGYSHWIVTDLNDAFFGDHMEQAMQYYAENAISLSLATCLTSIGDKTRVLVNEVQTEGYADILVRFGNS